MTPDPQGPYNFADAFKDTSGIGKKWILSEAKKDGVDENIAKYNGSKSSKKEREMNKRNELGFVF